MALLTNISLQLEEIAIKKVIEKQSVIKKRMAKEAKEMNLLRLNRGIDTRGRRIPKLSKLYRKLKGSARGRRQLKKGKGGDTSYAAGKQPNFGRLTGQTFTALNYKITFSSTKKSVSFTIKPDGGRRKKLWGWLEKMSRYYYGMSKSGAYKAREISRMQEIILEEINK